MSYHIIPALNPNHKIAVGWDEPLQSFFLKVTDRHRELRGEGEKAIAWYGTAFKELPELDNLKRRITGFAVIPNVLLGRLFRDKDEGK